MLGPLLLTFLHICLETSWSRLDVYFGLSSTLKWANLLSYLSLWLNEDIRTFKLSMDSVLFTKTLSLITQICKIESLYLLIKIAVFKKSRTLFCWSNAGASPINMFTLVIGNFMWYAKLFIRDFAPWKDLTYLVLPNVTSVVLFIWLDLVLI